jgi:hypothetical protein
MATPVAELMHGGPVPVDGLEIGLRPRDLNEIMDGAVEGAIAANAEVGAGRGDQCFGVRQDESFGNRCRSARQFRREMLALVGVEHGEVLEERNRVRLVTVALRPLPFLIGHEAIRIHDGGTMLALANVPAETERLAKRKPILGAEAVLDYSAPKDQHINPGVLALS